MPDDLRASFDALSPGFGPWLEEQGYEKETIRLYTGLMRRNATSQLIKTVMTADQAKGAAAQAFIRYRQEKWLTQNPASPNRMDDG